MSTKKRERYKIKNAKEESAYITDTPSGVTFFGSGGDLVCLAVDA